MRISVVIPSFRRPEHLERCLRALACQTVRAHELVVVQRYGDDTTTRVIVSATGPVIPVLVSRPGVLAALRAGVAASTGEIVAFTDDDAVPRAHWLEGLVRHLDDPRVGAIGGRDIVVYPGESGPPHARTSVRVGLLGGWGRMIGNHHVGFGPPRRVDVLKGVNMAFRRSALALPTQLRGGGAQVDWELACCLWASNRGWRLVYDPEIIVDHLVGPRFDRDRRLSPDPDTASDAAYNRLAILLALRPSVGIRRCLFGILIGERKTPGLTRGIAAIIRNEPDVFSSVSPSIRGQISVLLDLARRQSVRMTPAADLPQAVRVIAQ